MLLSRLTPSITTTRHRGAERDEDGKIIGNAAGDTIMAIAVAPGGGDQRIALARNGLDVAATVYYPAGTDLVNTDELTVRGVRYKKIIVNVWQIDGVDTGGVEVLCIRSQG